MKRFPWRHLLPGRIPLLPPQERTGCHLLHLNPRGKGFRGATGRGYQTCFKHECLPTTIIINLFAVLQFGPGSDRTVCLCPTRFQFQRIRSPGCRLMLAGSWEVSWDCWPRDMVLSTWPPGLPHSMGQCQQGGRGSCHSS